jgi:hypothetical protein
VTVTDVPDLGASAEPVRFAPAVWLSKQEAFAACQSLADADRKLVGVGGVAEAAGLGDLFELLEERLTGVGPAAGAQACSGSNSMDSEFTQ